MKKIKVLALVVTGLLTFAFVSGCLEDDGTKLEPSPVKNRHDEGILTLYFADQDANFLLVEERALEGGAEVAPEVALSALIEGPKIGGRFATIPKETELLDIEIKDEFAYVNFNKGFVDNYMLGSAAEAMTIYSVVNTLTEFKEIKSVKFLSEGKSLDIIGSNFDFRVQVFERNEDLIGSER
ncbi:MAG: GerMN domain-containing protein [Actinomycetota bacterium]|nr:GerMN domain-containing protein [Actinomycetota bacterium]